MRPGGFFSGLFRVPGSVWDIGGICGFGFLDGNGARCRVCPCFIFALIVPFVFSWTLDNCLEEWMDRWMVIVR
jgi:hypothetical protein